ncbi:MAG: DNA polymerase III subunit delta' [Gammaproteobacteria bacterium]|nr:DNA polymerase III subunit delta' [Gammaproteobacteria bacterium]
MQYPWHVPIWQHLAQRYCSAQLSHALLLSGNPGLGKAILSEQFAQWILCEAATKRPQLPVPEKLLPCGKCNGCLLYSAASHPDLMRVSPESEGKAITVDAVRNIANFLALKSQFAEYQVVIVAPAEAMNKYAANSLLKTLEEPTPNTLLLLVSHNMGSLLPTIRSRCQVISCPVPDATQANDWLTQAMAQSALPTEDTKSLLMLAEGSPLLALEYAKAGTLSSYKQLLQSFEKLTKKQSNPVEEVGLWLSVGLAPSLKWMYLWVAELIRFKSGVMVVDNNTILSEPVLGKVAESVESMRLYTFLDKITDSIRTLPTQVNVQLTVEDLLISWSRLNR